MRTKQSLNQSSNQPLVQPSAPLTPLCMKIFYAVVLCIVQITTFAQSRILNARLVYSTVRIENIMVNNITMIGTGFFYLANINGTERLTIVTNKHVISDSKICHFRITESDGNNNPTQNYLDLALANAHWYLHPSEDIAVLIVDTRINEQFKRFGKNPPLIACLSNGATVINNESDKIQPWQQVYMVGYPEGMLDEKNNIPISRTGIVSTPYKMDFSGRKAFLVDIPVFHGCSGSPIIIEDGDRGVKLLGIATETIIGRDKIPLGLAVAIKSELLYEMEKIISDIEKP